MAAWLSICLGSVTAKARRACDAGTIEAAMVHKICTFVSWPPSAGLTEKDSVFVMTVLGHSPITERLLSLYTRRNLHGCAVVVRRAARVEEIGPTHVLFITGAFEHRLEDVLRHLAGAPTLTIGNTPGLGKRGVAVNLSWDGDHLRFEINRVALHSAGLRASYKLLSLARLIGRD